MKLPVFTILGFLAGTLIGFAWSQGVKKSAPGRVETDVTGGMITVKFDAKGAATDGLLSLLG